jgi:transcriptional regulator with XRE-family HTH domain
MAGNEIARRFGANFARARERAGISQEEVGFRASLHRTEVGQLERGVRLARIDTLVKLAGALGVPPGSLLDGMAWEPGEFAAGAFRLPPAEEQTARRDRLSAR